MKPWVKKLLKALFIIILFVVMYAGIMICAYHYFYKYPKGYLDTLERNDGYKLYEVDYTENYDEYTLMYFARSNAGYGTKIHVGTLYCDKPEIIANFFCKDTSSNYSEANNINYSETSDGKCYLYGLTTYDSVDSMKVIIHIDDKNTKEYDLIYDYYWYYNLNFNKADANYPVDLVAYNEDGSEYYKLSFDCIKNVSIIEQ